MQEGHRGALDLGGGQVAEVEEGLEVDELPQTLGDFETAEHIDQILEDILADDLIDGFVYIRVRLVLERLLDTREDLREGVLVVSLAG